jgi:hypothetical protein
LKEKKMNKRFSILAGIVLILMGALALTFNLVAPTIGLDVWRWGTWRFWPLLVVGGGLLFVLPPFLVRGRRGLGGLFIPGVPILTTGGILLLASVFNTWGVWAYLWPLEILALALGFLFAAIYMRLVWLVIPAIVVGLNGLVLQFCALTGLWSAWAVLWTVEPLSVGLSLLVISVVKRSGGLFVAGLILCGLTGIGVLGMLTILSEWRLLGLLGPAILILAGFLLLIQGMIRRSPSHAPAVE